MWGGLNRGCPDKKSPHIQPLSSTGTTGRIAAHTDAVDTATVVIRTHQTRETEARAPLERTLGTKAAIISTQGPTVGNGPTELALRLPTDGFTLAARQRRQPTRAEGTAVVGVPAAAAGCVARHRRFGTDGRALAAQEGTVETDARRAVLAVVSAAGRDVALRHGIAGAGAVAGAAGVFAAGGTAEPRAVLVGCPVAGRARQRGVGTGGGAGAPCILTQLTGGRGVGADVISDAVAVGVAALCRGRGADIEAEIAGTVAFLADTEGGVDSVVVAAAEAAEAGRLTLGIRPDSGRGRGRPGLRCRGYA